MLNACFFTDAVSPEGGSIHIDQNHSASLRTSCQNEERSLNKMGTAGEPQLSTQDSKSQNNPELSSVSTCTLFSFIKAIFYWL